MTPYYEADGIAIYHGRCEDVLPTLRGDAVVTDPPYGIADRPIQGQGRTASRCGRTNTWHPASDWDREIDPAWGPLVCAAAPIVAWFGQWRKREAVASAMSHPLRAEIVWAKNCHVGAPCPVAPRDERIWLFSAGGIKGRTFETSVWDSPIIPTWAHKRHKNEKPAALMERLIAFLTDAGQLVIDPFMGSGTTLVAANNLRRRAIGIEQREADCESAARRLAQGILEIA